MNLPVQQPSLADALSSEALDDLLLTLIGYGNTINPATAGGRAHIAALQSVIETYTRLAFEQHQERIAYPLATGLGKTQSAIAWIRAADRLDACVSVLVCQEQIDSLEDFYRDLIKDNGVSPDKVGLLHSNPKHATIPSINPADAGQYPILLVTHARIKGPTDAEYLNQYGVGERSLVIWDESLIKSQSRCLAASDVEMAQAAASVILSGDWSQADETDAGDLIGYLKRSLRTLKHALHAKSSETLYMEPRTADQIDFYVSKISQVLKGRGINAAAKDTLLAFVRISQNPLRMVYLGEGDRGDGAITYLLTVPDSFKRIVILDASCGVRELCRQDSKITMDASHETTAKRFDALKVTQWITAGGRSTMANWRRNSKTIKSYLEYLKSLPAHEAVLTVTYKDGRKAVKERFHELLDDAGIDSQATVSVQLWNTGHQRMEWHERPKYEFITWGREKAVSRYSYCQHMVALGVLRRDPLELAAQITGQREDLNTELAADRNFVRHVQASEQFYHLQQFIGRGSCREVINGQSKAASVRVYDQADFTPFAEQGLPGATWVTELPPKAPARKRGPRSNTKVSELADKIVEHVRTLPLEKASVMSLKDGMKYTGSRTTFGRSLEAALKTLPWVKEGRSIRPEIRTN